MINYFPYMFSKTYIISVAMDSSTNFQAPPQAAYFL